MAIDWEAIKNDRQKRMEINISDWENMPLDRAMVLMDKLDELRHDGLGSCQNEETRIIYNKFRENSPWLLFKALRRIRELENEQL